MLERGNYDSRAMELIDKLFPFDLEKQGRGYGLAESVYQAADCIGDNPERSLHIIASARVDFDILEGCHDQAFSTNTIKELWQLAGGTEEELKSMLDQCSDESVRLALAYQYKILTG